MRVLGISGSLRAGSHNTALLRAAERELPADVRFEILDGLRDVPPYVEDDDTEQAPPAVARLRAEIAAADALLVATPEYNGSVPGWLKNVIDWASRPRGTSPLRFKPVLVVGATTGSFGAVWAQADLRKVLATSGARVVDGELGVARAHEAFGPDGELLDQGRREVLRGLLTLLVEEADQDRIAA